MVREAKALGLETCCTRYVATSAEALKAAGLDYYNYNSTPWPEFMAR
jgi:biotin synthase